MLDDLRNSSDSPLFEEEDHSLKDYYDPMEDDDSSDNDGLILGMTAPQRFIITLIVLIMTCFLGAGCLILSEKVVLPFL